MSYSSEMTNLTNSGKENEETTCHDEKRNGESASKTRETWSRKSEFILVLIGYTVGLGNIWRFPYLCYKNGGGAFLVPYTLFAAMAGIPMFFLEVSLGQYTKQTALEIWKLVPSMKGIGYGSTLLNLFAAIYYVMVMAWAALYLSHSCLPGPLPWTSCDNWWNTDKCLNRWKQTENLQNVTGNITQQNVSVSVIANNTTLPEAEFWNNYVLRKSSGIDKMGGFENWPLILCFVASWLVVYFCIFKGIRSSGKVVYVSAILPYIMLSILLVRGLTLEGASDGIVYLLKPNFTKLAEVQVWVDAGGQIFFSYGICFTILTTFGSYNKFHNDCYKQGIFLAITCSLSSLFACFAIFSILGHMAFVESKDISEVATQGPGLVFQVFPRGLALLPLPRLWSIIFFIVLFMVGIDSQFASVEGAIAIITEKFPWMKQGKYGTEKSSAVISLIILILGIPLLTNGGIYIFELFNMYSVSGICLLFITFFESLSIGWIYGMDRFYDNVKSMIGYYPSSYFKFCFRFFTPVLTMSTFLFFCVSYKPLVLDGYVYPLWADGIGWILSLASILCVPGYFAWFVWNSDGSLLMRIRLAFSPGTVSSKSTGVCTKI